MVWMWAITMSTSDRDARLGDSQPVASDLAGAIDLVGAKAAAAAGMPDPSMLARLARELFALGEAGGYSNELTRLSAAISGDAPVHAQPGSLAAPGAQLYAPTIAPLESSMHQATADGMAAASSSPANDPSALARTTLAPEFAFLADVRSLESLATGSSSDAGHMIGSGTSLGAPASIDPTLRSLAGLAPSIGVPGAVAPAALPTTGSHGSSATDDALRSVPAASQAIAAAGAPYLSQLASPTAAGRLPLTPSDLAAAASVGGLVPSQASSLNGIPLAADAVHPFGFLQDVRSLDAAIQSATNQAASTAGSSTATPSEAHLRTAAAQLPAAPSVQAFPAPMPTSAMVGHPTTAAPFAATGATSSPQVLPFGISLADAASPALAGATQPSASLTRDALGFIELSRPLESALGRGAGGTATSNTAASLAGLGNPAPLSRPTSPAIVGPLTPTTLGAADFSSVPFDVHAVRRDFPILNERVNGRPLVWLDNAATTQKPRAVIDRMKYYFEHENSNVHRAAHTLAARSTDAYEAAREKVARFLNAASSREIIFVRGATEGINLIAQTWGKRHIGRDDEIIITHLEHHANIVPWQMLCGEKGAKLRVAPVDDTGQIILEEYERLFNSRTRLVSFPHVSNALGTVTPVREMVQIARRHGATVVIDGAQGLSHMRVDMQEYDCDFYVFSGHKLFAPTGIGVVYGKADILENLPPYQGGGNMIADVTFERTVYNPPPIRFEAGTGSIADAVGLGAAIDYLTRLGMPNIARYEHDLLVYGTDLLKRIPGVRLIGTAREKASVLSFVLDGYRTEDVGAALANEGIAVRSGHHCAQPILRRFGVESTVRPSLAFYNTCEELDALAAAIWNIKGGRTPSVI